MTFEILGTILSALASLGAGLFVSSEVIQKLLRRRFHKDEPKKSYSDRLTELTTELTKASKGVDTILLELAQVAKNRESAVKKIEDDLVSMENREKELKEKIEILQNVPIPVAEHLAKILEPSEKRNARRDYLLFGAGVLVTTFIAIIIQAFS